MPVHALPELADIAMLLGFFVLVFASANILARVRGFRD